MIFAKRVGALLVVSILITIYLLRSKTTQTLWPGSLQASKTEEGMKDTKETTNANKPTSYSVEEGNFNSTLIQPLPGTAKQHISGYSRGVVLGHLAGENVTWLKQEDFANLQAYIYVVDDPNAPLHLPQNKGNEAMVYLTYIIDHYDKLPDVTMFIHGHQMAWHTNEMLNHDSLEMIKRLSSERVLREGYMNLRCHWDPGCPARIRPGAAYTFSEKGEQIALPQIWAEWFPNDPLPDILGAPCCAQFALSREKIRSIPKSGFEFYRNWLIETPLNSWTSGRIFEHLWHKIFTGEAKVCPNMRVCYCDGYGICFQEQKEFDYWFEMRYKHREAEKELRLWKEKAENLDALDRQMIEELRIEIPEPGRNIVLQAEIDRLFDDMSERRLQAMKLGVDPKIRAEVAGRRWKEGDGY